MNCRLLNNNKLVPSEPPVDSNFYSRTYEPKLVLPIVIVDVVVVMVVVVVVIFLCSNYGCRCITVK